VCDSQVADDDHVIGIVIPARGPSRRLTSLFGLTRAVLQAKPVLADPVVSEIVDVGVRRNAQRNASGVLLSESAPTYPGVPLRVQKAIGRDGDRRTAIDLLVEASCTFPVIAAVGEKAVTWRVDRRARCFYETIAALASPAWPVAVIHDVGMRGNNCGYATLLLWAKAAITLPSVVE